MHVDRVENLTKSTIAIIRQKWEARSETCKRCPGFPKESGLGILLENEIFYSCTFVDLKQWRSTAWLRSLLWLTWPIGYFQAFEGFTFILFRHFLVRHLLPPLVCTRLTLRWLHKHHGSILWRLCMRFTVRLPADSVRCWPCRRCRTNGTQWGRIMACVNIKSDLAVTFRESRNLSWNLQF